MPRSSLFVALAAVALSTVPSSRYEPALRLRIQALSQDSLQVRVRMTASMPYQPQRWSDTVAQTPLVLSIAESIQIVHIGVSGLESVRATLTDPKDPGRNPVTAEGRDLTLSRDARGRFHRVWTAQPVVP